MTQNQKTLVVFTAAAAGGLIAFALLAPERLCARRANSAGRRPGRTAIRLDRVEERLSDLEHQIQQATDELRARVAEVGQRTRDHYLPGGALSDSEWQLSKGDVDEDLPRLKGGA